MLIPRHGQGGEGVSLRSERAHGGTVPQRRSAGSPGSDFVPLPGSAERELAAVLIDIARSPGRAETGVVETVAAIEHPAEDARAASGEPPS